MKISIAFLVMWLGTAIVAAMFYLNPHDVFQGVMCGLTLGVSIFVSVFIWSQP